MDETQANTTSTLGAEPNKECPSAPRPQDYEEPCYPNDEIYGDIPPTEIDAVEKTYNTSIYDADKAYAIAITDAVTARKKAESAFDVAMTIIDSNKKQLKSQIVFEKKENILPAYRSCLHEALPNNCKNIKADVPKEKEAVCIAKLIKGMSDQDLAYQNGIQTILQEKADAERAWAKAKEQYDSTVCIANATRKAAYDDAQVTRRVALATALEAACKL